MKTLHQVAIEPLFRPKRQSFVTPVMVNPSGQAKYGGIKTYSSPLVGADTLLSMAAPASAITGTIVSKASSANQYLIIQLSSASPYIAANLYDSAKRTLTALTISGALAASSTTAEGSSLCWSTTRSAWYLKSGGENKVYPLTISGTTLTVGTAIDISGSFATAANCQMVGDTGDGLYIYDVSANVFKKFTLSGVSAGSFGSALTNPTAGFYTTNAKSTHLGYSNGKIYFAAAASATGTFYTFQEYSVAGATWTTKTVPTPLRIAGANISTMMCDPSDNTYVYFSIPTGAVTSTGGTANSFGCYVRWISASDTWEYYGSPHSLGPGMVRPSEAPGGLGNSSYFKDWIRGGFYSQANNDIGVASNILGTTSGTEIFNVGSKWGRANLVTYSGAGYLLGVIAPINPLIGGTLTGAVFASDLVNADVVVAVTIDGGTERLINIGSMDPKITQNLFNLAFSTSLSVDIIGGGPALPSANNHKYPMVTAFVNITS